MAKDPPNRDRSFSVPTKYWSRDHALGVAVLLEHLESLEGMSVHILDQVFLFFFVPCLNILDALLASQIKFRPVCKLFDVESAWKEPVVFRRM